VIVLMGNLCHPPSALTKNTFPIGELASSLFILLLRAEGGSRRELLFLARGKTKLSFNDWSKSRAALDKLSGAKNCTLHDLRRTFAAPLAEIRLVRLNYSTPTHPNAEN
jgi:integrase